MGLCQNDTRLLLVLLFGPSTFNDIDKCGEQLHSGIDDSEGCVSIQIHWKKIHI